MTRPEKAWPALTMSCLLIEPWDFTQPLSGNGCAAVCASAIRHLGPSLKLVGATSNGGVGRWTKVTIAGSELDFLPVVETRQLKAPRLRSASLAFAWAVSRFSREIDAAHVPAVLTQTYTVLWLFTLHLRGWDVCFYYPGLANPLVVGRRPRLGRLLARLYDRVQAAAVKRAAVAFAAASQDAVREYNERLQTFGVSREVHPLPTAVDLALFQPRPKRESRSAIGLPLDAIVFAVVGRLAAVKGIPLLFDALQRVRRREPSALLLVVGDGEEAEKLRALVRELELSEAVRFLGNCPPDKVAEAINAADVGVCGSHAEGFSVAMVEQMACGRPIVSTQVSGADELIEEGRNGFVVKSRDPAEFAQRMLDAVRLPQAGEISRGIAEQRYSDQALWQKVSEAWPALQAA